MAKNSVASHCQPFQEIDDHHRALREKDLAPALMLWKNSWAIFAKPRRRLPLCC